MTRPFDAGFTLVELVIVIIVVAVGLLGIARMFGDSVSTLVVGEDVQRAAQQAQECAEMILAKRRTSGFGSVATTTCDDAEVPAGFIRAITLTEPPTYTGSAATACPDGVTCQDVTVTVTKGSISAATTIMLVSY
jgi:prepilin-type N-terminal cleavage/methylation domain-containing protein